MNSNMEIMNRPWKLGALEIRNRLVRSATAEYLSTPDGAPTEALTALLEDLARGGVGLIIAGTAYVSEQGKGDPGTTGLHRDDLVPPLRRMCERVLGAGGVLAAQLLHCGTIASPAALAEKDVLWGPSPMTDPVCGRPVQGLDREGILEIIGDFGRAADRAKRAGFRAVQIHAGHGYLLNQFLSPFRNRRRDAYGGSIENRARFLCEVYEAIRGVVGRDFPVFVKLSGYDGFDKGLQSGDAVQVARILDGLGIDAVEVSAGTPDGAVMGGWDHILPAPFEEGSLFSYALEIKDAVDCPVISVEGWRDPKAIGQALEKVDAVSMSRPFIREPRLADRWQSGDPDPARCISCNRCLGLLETDGLTCIFNRKKRHQNTMA